MTASPTQWWRHAVVYQIYRSFHAVLDEFEGERMAVIETGADP